MRLRGRDFRSLENPISAIFDLADEVNEVAPWAVQRSRYAIVFNLFSLIVTFILIVAALTNAQYWLFPIILCFFIAGIMALQLTFRNRRFFHYFANRHAAIRTVRESEMADKVPAGRTPEERYMRYLKDSNHTFLDLSREHPDLMKASGTLKGHSGESYRFEAVVHRRNRLPFGKPDYLLLVKAMNRFPTIEEYRNMEDHIADIAMKMKAAPSRFVLLVASDGPAYRDPRSQGRRGGLWTDGGRPMTQEEYGTFRSEPPAKIENNLPSNHWEMSDELYDHLVDRSLTVKIGRKREIVPSQVVAEMDGYYDFVPMIPEIDGMLP